MKRFIVSIIFVIVISGCSTTKMLAPEQAPNLTPKKDTAQLVIMYDTFSGEDMVFRNYLDGKFIGETTGQTYFISHVQPGKHYVLSTAISQVPSGKRYNVIKAKNSGVIQLDFKAGRSYYLRQQVAMTPRLTRIFGFFPVTSKEALESAQNCTYLELDPAKSFPDMKQAKYQAVIEKYQASLEQGADNYKEIIEYQGE